MTPEQNNRHTNICFDCKNACGGCPWSAFDSQAGKPRFEPVPGWTAEPVTLGLGRRHGRQVSCQTYHITACPMFVRG